MTLRSIIFDLGNVVNFWEPELALQGLYPTDQALAEAMEQHRLREWVGSVLDAGADVEASLVEITKANSGRATLLRTYMDNISLAHAHAVPGTLEIIQDLAATGR